MRTGAIEPDITAAGTINLLTLRHPGRATPVVVSRAHVAEQRDEVYQLSGEVFDLCLRHLVARRAIKAFHCTNVTSARHKPAV
jgi:hypothetical protein